jgi:hypothetical protein
MHLTQLVLLAAEETHEGAAAIPPIWIGAGTFVGLLLLLLVVLALGKGRPHS